MDGTLYLAAVGGHAVAGFKIGGAAQLGHAAVGALDHLVAAHDIGAHEPHLAARAQPLEFRRRDLGKVAVLDVQFACERYRAGGRVGHGLVGIVGQVEVFHLAGG